MSVRSRLLSALRGEVVTHPVYVVYDAFLPNPAVDWERLFALGLGQVNHAFVVAERRPNCEVVETRTVESGLETDAAKAAIPHAWKAGTQTTTLRDHAGSAGKPVTFVAALKPEAALLVAADEGLFSNAQIRTSWVLGGAPAVRFAKENPSHGPTGEGRGCSKIKGEESAREIRRMKPREPLIVRIPQTRAFRTGRGEYGVPISGFPVF